MKTIVHYNRTIMLNVHNIGFLHLLFVTNIMFTNGDFVPDLVQVRNASSVVLECDSSMKIEPYLLLQWYFNDNKEPIYQWRPHEKPIVSGVLEGHLNLSSSKSGNSLEPQRKLHIYNLRPDMSGEYTCVAQFDGGSIKETKTILVFSTQEDLSINWKLDKTEVEVRCTTQGVYPKPDLLLLRDGIRVDKQHSRSWQSGRGVLYDAETVASFLPQELRDSEEFACHLGLPETDYNNIKKMNIIFRNSTHNSLEAVLSHNSAITLSSHFGYCVMPSVLYSVLTAF